MQTAILNTRDYLKSCVEWEAELYASIGTGALDVLAFVLLYLLALPWRIGAALVVAWRISDEWTRCRTGAVAYAAQQAYCAYLFYLTAQDWEIADVLSPEEQPALTLAVDCDGAIVLPSFAEIVQTDASIVSQESAAPIALDVGADPLATATAIRALRAEGIALKTIAQRLGVTLQTVKTACNGMPSKATKRKAG